MQMDAFKTLLSTVYNIDNVVVPQLDIIIARSIKKISEYYPYPETSSIVTTAGQTRYTVNHDGLIKIKNVFYNKPSSINPFGDSDIPTFGKHFGDIGLSMQMTNIYEHETQRRISPVDANIISFNQFDLIPTPKYSMTIYYEYDRYRTIEEIPELLEDEMVSLVMFYRNDPIYQANRNINNGSVFNFDRRGNTTVDSNAGETSKELRDNELKDIIRAIKVKVTQLGGN